MKKILILAAFLICKSSFSQQNYSFSKLTDTYSDISGLSLFGNGQIWNNEGLNWNFQLPFNFNIAGTNYSVFSYDGSVIELFSTNGSSSQLYAHGIYINDKSPSTSGVSISPVGYKTEGTIGNRIVKIQFKNVGSSSEYAFFNTRNITMNFQVWLYETSNVIEYRIGSNNVNSNLDDIQEILMFGISREIGNSFVSVLYGPHTNTSYGEYTNPDQIDLDNYGMSSYPIENTVFRFTPSNTASTHLFKEKGFKLFPNPASNIINIEYNDFVVNTINSIEIFDTTGRRILEIFNQFEQIDINELSYGNYLIKINTEQETYVSRFIKE